MGKEADEQLDDESSAEDVMGFDFDDDSKASEFLDLEGEQDAEADEEASEASPEGGAEAEGASDEESQSAEELEAEGEPGEEGTPAEELSEEAADEGPFQIGDRSYDTWEQAEQAFKSALGQQGRASELERTNAELMVALAGAKNQIEGVGSAAQPAKPAEEKKGPLKLGDVVDPRVYQKLVEDPEVGSDGALSWLMEKFQTVLEDNNKHMRESWSEDMKPFVADSEQTEAFKGLVGTFEAVGNKVDKDGNFLYPELNNDAGFVEAVTTRIFNTPGLAESGEMGVYLGLLAEREWRKMQGIETDTGQAEEVEESTAPSNGDNAASSATEELEEEEESVDGLDVVDDGGTTPLPSKPRNEGERVASKIQRELLEAETNIDPDIGFDY